MNTASLLRPPSQVLPVPSEARLIVVDLVKSLSSMRTDTILHLVKEVVKKPHQIKAEQVWNAKARAHTHTHTHTHAHTHTHTPACRQKVYRPLIHPPPHQKATLVDVPMLEFSYAYIQRYGDNSTTYNTM